MMKRRARNRDDATPDLFAEQLFPVRRPADLPHAISFRAELSQAISRALRECPKARPVIAAEMSVLLGETISEGMLNNYASTAHTGHDITVTRLKALVRVTGATWLWEVALEGDGLTIMQGEEALFAQLGVAQAMERRWGDERKRLQGQLPDPTKRGRK